MRILYIDHYAGSPALGMEYRPYYLAREWAREGHEVLVLAASFSHVRTRQPEGVVDAPREEMLDGVAYRWYPAPAYEGNGLGRMRNIWRFLSQVWVEAPQLVQRLRPDVVIASSTYPMDIWVARRAARLCGAVLAFEVHDLWPLSPIELSGMSPWHPFALLCRKAESDAYRDSDVVVSMLPKVHAYMRSRGLDLSKLHVVPNGIAPEDPPSEGAPLREDVAGAIARARCEGRKVVGYAGSHGLPNALDDLLNAAELLRDEPFQFILVGDGHEKARLAQRVQSQGLDRVALLAPIPKAQVPSLLQAVDIAYIGWQRVPIYRFGIAPNKLMDYMMAARPVLHAVEAGNDPVAEAGCGVTVAPEDPQAIAQGLRRLAALPAEARRAMGERGRAFVLANHAYPVLARRFLDAVRSASRSKLR